MLSVRQFMREYRRILAYEKRKYSCSDGERLRLHSYHEALNRQAGGADKRLRRIAFHVRDMLRTAGQLTKISKEMGFRLP